MLPHGEDPTTSAKRTVKPSCSVPGCDRPTSSRGWCRKHYSRWLAHGDPLFTKNPNLGLPLADRFWPRVDRSGECWVWTGGRDSCGYGQIITPGRRHDRAHRVSWILAYGEIPDGMHVLHRCDNPPCVRPDHLFLGTQQDNMADMLAKGRGRIPKAGQHDTDNALILTRDQIAEIRACYTGRYGERSRLARKYGVHPSTIYSIVTNTKHRRHTR